MDRKILYFLTCLASFLIFFQIHVSWDTVSLNINFADPIALCGLFIVLFSYAPSYIRDDLRIPYTLFFLVLFIILFSLSLGTAIFYREFFLFSIVNKFMGLFVLFGYTALGALFIKAQGREGLKSLTRIMVTVLCTIILWRISVSLASVYNLIPSSYNPSVSLMGYANNRNAFCLQILGVLALIFSQEKPYLPKLRVNTYWTAGFFLMTIYITYSRSGGITAMILLMSLFLFKFLRFNNILRLLLITCGLVLVIYGIDELPHLLRKHSAQGLSILNRYSGADSDTERLYSFTQALKLWWTHPWFGLGIGGFLQHELLQNKRPLVIHNTFLWILAEFGIIGFIGFASYGFVWVKTLSLTP